MYRYIYIYVCLMYNKLIQRFIYEEEKWLGWVDNDKEKVINIIDRVY